MHNSSILGRYPGKMNNSPKWLNSLKPSPYIPFSSKDKTRFGEVGVFYRKFPGKTQ